MRLTQAGIDGDHDTACGNVRQKGFQAESVAWSKHRPYDMGKAISGKRASRQRAERIAGRTVRADAQKGYVAGFMPAADIRKKGA
ncbi:hypothetical protein J2TS6_53500 [Paenibacillus albilobatus]|uniref:Uncharacterized protein n=1 Tax=Paenibacillus albilobatus TaxID=2716884 RepID=A0A920CER9_9BACL|nr:hypothetical protein J2TS6_53500 [Paenibacillus albilobatus]